VTVPFLAIGSFAVAVGFFVEHCIAADDRKATRSEKSREMHQKSREKRNKKQGEMIIVIIIIIIIVHVLMVA
jgi:hypothetical protein